MSRKQPMTAWHHVASNPLISITTLGMILATIGLSLYLSGFFYRPSAPELFLDVQADVSEAYNNIALATDEWRAESVSGLEVAVPGYDFRIASSVLHSFGFNFNEAGPRSSAPAALRVEDMTVIIDNRMKDAHMKRVELQDNIIRYSRDDNVCTLSYKDQVGTVACYNNTDISSIAAPLKPMIRSFVSATNVSQKDIVVNDFVIKSQNGSGVISGSRTSGYDIAEVFMTTNGSEKLALFYREATDDWQFGAQANDEFGFPCGEMSRTVSSRKAFYGQICLSENGQIRLDSPERALQ